MNTKSGRGDGLNGRGTCHIKIEHANKLKYHMRDIYLCRPACVCVCECFKAHLWPFVLVSFMHFPTRERERERETGSERDSVSEDIVRHFATLFTLCINECHLLILCHIMSAPDGRL